MCYDYHGVDDTPHTTSRQSIQDSIVDAEAAALSANNPVEFRKRCQLSVSALEAPPLTPTDIRCSSIKHTHNQHSHRPRFGDFAALSPARIRELGRAAGLAGSGAGDVAEIVARMKP